jgi:hypothetical protein
MSVGMMEKGEKIGFINPPTRECLPDYGIPKSILEQRRDALQSSSENRQDFPELDFSLRD